MEEDQKLFEPVATDMEADESEPRVQSVAEEPSVMSVSASIAKPMETEYSGFYEWELRDFAKKHERQISETFEIGTYLWRLLCFPRGNAPPHKNVALFLEYPEAAYTPTSLSPRASFKLIVKNHKDPKGNFSKESNHVFTPDQVDWGFSQMLPLVDVSLGSGYLREDGTLVVRVEITLQRDERYLYDSRAETGYVGLKNQGATCYMNSLLQYLYNVPYFRKAVYHMPVPENEEPSKSLPVALQSLFYKLQYARTAVSTKELTKSFGWNTFDAFMQHDVQELNRVLCEKLEEKMKNTKVEKTINELFEGHTYSYLECIGVAYKSTRKESFMDLQLDVKGCKNIYDSFDRYTEVEVLNGANQYKTDDFGMQDARKGILFEDFPPVLQLQLKRFEYDFQRDAMVKINDRYEFFEELDLDRQGGRYLAPGADRTVRNLYRLHSVLVHSGGLHGGHYYAYIRPDGETWLKFDDDRVSREDSRQALDAQFGEGGSDDDGYSQQPHGPHPPQHGPLPLKYGKCSNAYMLVYVRQSDWPTIMCGVAKEDIAKHLLDRLEREMVDKEARHRDKMEAHLYCSLKVASDQDFKQQIGELSHFDLVDPERLPPERCHYRLRKQTKFGEFKEEVSRRTGIPPHRQRYWTWKRRNNGTYRPERPLTPAEEQAQLVDLRDIRDLPREGGAGAGAGRSALMDIRLYLEELPESAADIRPVCRDPRGGGPGELLLFFKYYDPLRETLTYRTHHLLPPGTLVDTLGRHLLEEDAEEADAPPSAAPALLFEEIKFDPAVMVPRLDPRKQLQECEIQHGDVIIYQRQLSPEQAAGVRYPTADAYLSYVHNRRQVHFKRLEEPAAAPAVSLELLRTATYDEVCSSLAGALGLADPTKLRLTRQNYFSCQPQRQAVKWRTAASLEVLLTHGSHATDTLYFEVLDLPLVEMEQLKTVKVSFHNERGEYVGEQHSLRLRREATVADLLAELAARLQQAAAAAAANRAAAAAAGGASQEAAAAAAGQGSNGGGAVAEQQRLSQGGNGGSVGGAPSAAAAQQAAADEAALAVAAQLAAAGRPMRLLEMSQSKLFKVVEPTETIEALNDSYWQLRAEFIPEDQLAAGLSAADTLVHMAHMLLPPLPPKAAAYLAARQQQVQQRLQAAAEAAQQGQGSAGGAVPMEAEGAGSRVEEVEEEEEEEEDDDEEEQDDGGEEGDVMQVGRKQLRRALLRQMPGATFGDPLLLRVREHETMGQLRSRIQAMFNVPPVEFTRWHLLFVGTRPNNALLRPKADLTAYFGGHQNKYATAGAAEAAAAGQTEAILMDPHKLTLAVLHEDKGGNGARRQPPAGSGASRYAHEKPVKIYG